MSQKPPTSTTSNLLRRIAAGLVAALGTLAVLATTMAPAQAQTSLPIDFVAGEVVNVGDTLTPLNVIALDNQRYEYVSGDLPPGISFQGDGSFLGNVGDAGSWTFLVRTGDTTRRVRYYAEITITSTFANTDFGTLEIMIESGSDTSVPILLDAVTLGTSSGGPGQGALTVAHASLQADFGSLQAAQADVRPRTGLPSGMTVEIIDGVLPDGLQLDYPGVINGTATALEEAVLTVRINDVLSSTTAYVELTVSVTESASMAAERSALQAEVDSARLERTELDVRIEMANERIFTLDAGLLNTDAEVRGADSPAERFAAGTVQQLVADMRAQAVQNAADLAAEASRLDSRLTVLTERLASVQAGNG